MTDKTQGVARNLTEEILKLNQQVIDFNLSMSKRAEKHVVNSFDSSRTTLETAAGLQRDMVKAWLDMVAPPTATA